MIENILLVAGNYLFRLISLMIVINIMLSWINPNPNHVLVKIVYGLTEPILSPLRRFAVIGRIDFSAVLAILLLQWFILPLYQMMIKIIF